MREFREADQLVDRAESTTKGERTSPFLLHQNGEIFTARYLRIFRVSFDLCKITEVLQALFGRVHTNRVEDISRRNQNLATNHLVLGACVTGNIDPVHKRAVALLDLIMHIDPGRTGRGAFGQNHQIDITAAPVSVGNCFRIIAELFWRIDAALLHF